MLTVLCKLLSTDRDIKKTQYFAKVYKRDVLNTSKGKVDEIPLLCTREFLIDLLTLTTVGIRKKCGAEYANLEYRPDNVYYLKDTDELCIGKQLEPGNVLEFDGETSEILSGDPLQIIVGYRNSTTNEILGYLVSEYKNGEFLSYRITEDELIQKLVSENITCCNALVAINDLGEQFIDRKNQGFQYTLDVSDVTQLKKVTNVDKEALKLTEKTVKINRETKLGQMMNNANANIIEWLSMDKNNVCTEEQKLFLAEYYSWYTKRTFEFLQGSTNIKMRAAKIMALDSLHLSKNVVWKHVGYYTSPTRSFKCSDPSCGHMLTKAHVFECEDPSLGKIKLMFGADCAEQFFDMTSDNLQCLADASEIVQTEIQNIFDIFRNDKVEQTWDELGMFKDTIVELDSTNNLVNTYGESNAKWLQGFLKNNIPFPDSLVSTVITSITRNSTEMKEDERNKAVKKEVNLVRTKALNTVYATQTDEQFHAISREFWTKKEPKYSEFIEYFPESKEYFDFVLQYKMYGRPLTGDALDKFNAKHKTTLRRLKWFVNAKKYNALELAQVTELLKLELDISKSFNVPDEIKGLYTDADFVRECVEICKNSNFLDEDYSTLYLLALLRPYLPNYDVTNGDKKLKEGVVRRRIPLSEKSRLITINNKYDFCRRMRNSYCVPNYYKCDYDGDSVSKSLSYLESSLDGLKKNRSKFDDFVTNILLAELKDKSTKKMERENKKRQEELLKLEKISYARLQNDNGYSPFDIERLESLYEEPLYKQLHDEIGLSITKVGLSTLKFSIDGERRFSFTIDSERVFDDKTYDYYSLYSNIGRFNYEGLILDLDKEDRVYGSLETKYDKKYDLDSLYDIGFLIYKSSWNTILEVQNIKTQQCIFSLVVGNRGLVEVTNDLDVETSDCFEYFTFYFKTLRYKKLDGIDYTPYDLLKDKSNVWDLEFLSSFMTPSYKLRVYDIDKEIKYACAVLGDMYIDKRGSCLDVTELISDLPSEQQFDVAKANIKEFNYSDDILDVIHKYYSEDSEKDILDILKELNKQYPNVVSNKMNMDLVNRALKENSFDKLSNDSKKAVVQVICDKISYNNLDRSLYNLDKVKRMLNFTDYFKFNTELGEEVDKYMNSLSLNEFRLEKKLYSILCTMSKSRKCTDRQRTYLQMIRDEYNKAMLEKKQVTD